MTSETARVLLTPAFSQCLFITVMYYELIPDATLTEDGGLPFSLCYFPDYRLLWFSITQWAFLSFMRNSPRPSHTNVVKMDHFSKIGHQPQASTFSTVGLHECARVMSWPHTSNNSYNNKNMYFDEIETSILTPIVHFYQSWICLHVSFMKNRYMYT